MNNNLYLQTIKEKYHLARYLDFNFDPDNYIWLISVEVYLYLKSLCGGVYIHDSQFDHSCKLMEIPVEVINGASEIRLLKEIK